MRASGSPGRIGRIGAVRSSADLGLLVHAQHHRSLGRVQVQGDDVADLGVQLRVGGELERRGPPWLQVPLAPDPGNGREQAVQMISEQPRRPVRHAELSRQLGHRRDHDRDLVHLHRATRAVKVVQRGNPASGIAVSPADHGRPGHPDPARDLGVRRTLGSQQHDPRSLCHPRPSRRRTHQRVQCLLITLTKRQRRSNRHTSLSRTHTVKVTYDMRH